VLFLRVFVPDGIADEVVDRLRAVDGVSHLARAHLVEPGSVVITADVQPGSVDAALESIEGFDIPGDDVLLARLNLIGPTRRQSPLARSADALIWSEVLGEARVQSRIVTKYLAFMLIAGTIAAFGVLNGNSILIVGAMAVSPDLLPLTAACVGIVGRRARLAGRAVGTLAIGLGLASLASFLVVTTLRALGLLGGELDLSGPLAIRPPNVDASTFVVAFAAGVAGMLAFETRASAAVGVAISVTTIPAAAYLGVSSAIGDAQGSTGAFQVLLVNVAMLLVAGTLTLAIQRTLGRAPTALAAVTRPSPDP
jgi:uncharacterized hydrophobic protein (TIGR00271 family)